MVSIDVPADVGAPPLNTTSKEANMLLVYCKKKFIFPGVPVYLW